MSVSLAFMSSNLQENETTDNHEFVYNKKQAFQRAIELVRQNLDEKRKQRNAIYKGRSMAQHTKRDKKFCCIILLLLLEQLPNSPALRKDRISLRKVQTTQYSKSQKIFPQNNQLYILKGRNNSLNLRQHPIDLKETNQETFSQLNT